MKRDAKPKKNQKSDSKSSQEQREPSTSAGRFLSVRSEAFLNDRMDLGLTQSELATKAGGLHYTAILRLESHNRDRRFERSTVIAVAKALGHGEDWIQRYTYLDSSPFKPKLTRIPKKKRFCIDETLSTVHNSSCVWDIIDGHANKRLFRTLCRAFTGHGPRIWVVHGPSGSGKTTLIRKCINHFCHSDETRDKIPQVFAWSFSEQGSKGTRHGDASPDLTSLSIDFMRAAKAHFKTTLGFEDPSANLAEQSGDFVGKAFRTVGGVMILDGFERFLTPPGLHDEETVHGEFTDLIRELLQSLHSSQQPRSLLIITSLWPLPESVFNRQPASCQQSLIAPLTPEEGATLLQSFRLKVKDKALGLIPHIDDQPMDTRGPMSPKDRDLAKKKRQLDLTKRFILAARFANCEPLAMIWLATRLIADNNGVLNVKDLNGQIHINEIEHSPNTFADSFPSAHRHSERILTQWVVRLTNAPVDKRDKSRRQLQALRLVCLFNEPLSMSLANTLLQMSTVPGLTDSLNAKLFLVSCKELESLNLLRRRAAGDYDVFHPLIRVVVRNHLSETMPTEFDVANANLFAIYSQLSASADDENQRLILLAKAIRHGCHSKSTVDSACDAYFEHLRKDSDGRDSWKLLASRSDDLVVLSNFFLSPFDTCNTALSKANQREVCNEAAYDLQKLCRYATSLPALQHAVEASKNERPPNLVLAIRDTVLLARSHLALLNIATAIELAHKTVEYAEELIQRVSDGGGTREWLRAVFAYSCLGQTFHFAGRVDEAEGAFCRQLSLEANAIAWSLAAEQVASDAEKRTAIESFRKMLPTQRLDSYAAYLIDTGREDKAILLLEESTSTCLHLASLKPDGMASVRDHVAFNNLLLGQAYCQLAEKTGESKSGEKAKQHLVSAGNEFALLDILDGLFYCRLALARLCIQQKLMHQARLHIGDAHQLAMAHNVPRFIVDCQAVRLEYYHFSNQKDLAAKNLSEIKESAARSGYFRVLNQIESKSSLGKW